MSREFSQGQTIQMVPRRMNYFFHKFISNIFFQMYISCEVTNTFIIHYTLSISIIIHIVYVMINTPDSISAEQMYLEHSFFHIWLGISTYQTHYIITMWPIRGCPFLISKQQSKDIMWLQKYIQKTNTRGDQIFRLHMSSH